MENLKLYNRYLAEAIGIANADEGEEAVDDMMDMSVQSLIDAFVVTLANAKKVNLENQEEVEEMLETTKGKEMLEILYSYQKEAAT